MGSADFGLCSGKRRKPLAVCDEVCECEGVVPFKPMNQHRCLPRCNLFPAITVIMLLFSCPVLAGDSPWTITPGLGHDQFEQIYFLEDTLELDPDSLQSLRQTIEELKESYASLEVAYAKGATSISNTAYFTDAAHRNVTQGRTGWRHGEFRVDAVGRLEWKGDDRRDSVSSPYLFNQVSVTPQFDVNDRWSVFTRGDWERTDYQSRSVLGLDYDRLRGRVGGRYSGSFLESVELSLGWTGRAVPDSTRLSYNELWIEGEAAYWEFGPTTWSLLLLYSDRSYERDGATRDHRRLSTELESRWQPSKVARLDARLAWESWDYAFDSGAYYDFSAGEIEIASVGSLSADWEVALDGRARWEAAMVEPFAEVDFCELAGGPSLTWQTGGWIWVELGSLWGRRWYDDASVVYDDFGFVEADLRADGTVGRHFTMSVAISYQEENHDDATRDADYIYGSVALRFPFRL